MRRDASAHSRHELPAPARPGSVGNLSLAIHHNWRPDRIFMLVTVYIDESGTHGANVMTVGGLVGRLGQWMTYDGKWNGLLSANDLPYFHLKRFKHNEPPFKGWTEARKDKFIGKLSRIIHKNTLFGFTIALRTDDYKRLYLMEERPRKARFDSKYGLCFRLCMSVVPDLVLAKYQKQGVDLHFVLEAGHRNTGDAKRIFDEFKDRGPPRIANMLRTITTGVKQDFPGLQGADIPAHIAFDCESKGDIPIVPLPRPATEMLVRKTDLSSAPIFRHYFSPDNLREARENAIEDARKLRFARQNRDAIVKLSSVASLAPRSL